MSARWAGRVREVAELLAARSDRLGEQSPSGLARASVFSSWELRFPEAPRLAPGPSAARNAAWGRTSDSAAGSPPGADPDGPAAAPALEAVQLALGAAGAPGGRRPGSSSSPSRRISSAARRHPRLAGSARRGTTPAQALRQRGRRRGHGRPGQGLGEEPEGERGAVHGLAPRPSGASLRATRARMRSSPRKRRRRARQGRGDRVRVRTCRGPRETSPGPRAGAAQPQRRIKRKRLAVALEQCAVVAQVHVVPAPRVVEARLDLHHEVRLAAHADHSPHERARSGADRHEVLDLQLALLRHEARDEHVGVGQVELLSASAARRAERPVAAAAGVEKRAEHARRVDARRAVPVDRPLGAHQRDRVQVADHAVLGDREVAARRGGPSGRRPHGRGRRPGRGSQPASTPMTSSAAAAIPAAART